MKTDNKNNVWLQITSCLLLVSSILSSQNSFAHSITCATDPSTLSGVIVYDTNPNNSYCELCSSGTVRLLVTNPTHRDMSDFVIKHDFQSSDLEYVPGSTVGGGDPAINGTELTWTAAEIPALAQIDGTSGGNHGFNTVEIIFQLRSISGTEEDLVTANRNVSATADYQFCPASTNVAATASTGQFELPLREPNPTVTKLGRNFDANQGSGSYSGTVYGNTGDDVIWRIQISNPGNAGLQDLKFDDVMGNTNFQINYACPSEADANNLAGANGSGPVGNCTSSGISNSISDFLVDNPFGNTAVAADGSSEVDITAGGSAFIYLVGKITDSCVANTSNTVSNIEWGCDAITPDGGITQTSSLSSPGSSTATLSSQAINSGLQIQRQLTGLNTAQDVGTRGLMTITINNQTGGSIKNLKLRDVLPAEYVVDSTFTPTIAVTPAYGSYPGMVNTLVWTNPAANTVPLTSPPAAADPADPLANTAPEFDLLSSTANPDYPDQVNMMRHGDVVVITFRVVMIEQSHFDNNSNIDVREENIGDNTDPSNAIVLNNDLYVTFENFCNPGATQQPSSYPYADTFNATPEDLDIDFTGAELIFILTNDPTQALPVQVSVTNRGGHYADDYTAYVTFGSTMEVVTAPAGCSVSANPPLLEVWDDPTDLPATATVYQCSSAAFGTIPPNSNQPLVLNFEVIKTSNAAGLAEDDLSLRADVIGEIALSDGTLLWFPTVQTAPINNRANNYSLDSVRARVIGFNLAKNLNGDCSENNPASTTPDSAVQIGEECTVRIDTGGWFGFQTPGFTYIAVQKIQVTDELPDGQAYISSVDPTPLSSSSIKGIVLNPVGLSPLTEFPLANDGFSWTFNQDVVTERITVKDQWFRVDATTRILNKPVDNSAVPNVHAALSRNILNSTFEAVFNNALTLMEEIFLLGPGTIGYPSEPLRRVDLRVTEPNVLVTKEVCNETLYGVGPSCSNFVPLADDGDTQDSYIYRITLINQASASGYARAPAYNLTTTDILDDSDLVLIEDFATDGLDNDGDGLIDGADGDGEGSINDNNVSNAVIPEITFSHTHSSALLRLDPYVPGNEIELYYRINPDDAVAPLQQLNNDITVQYDSLEGDSGNQTVVLSANSELGGARVYTSSVVSATVEILPLQSQPKEIITLSNTTISGGQPQAVSVGEEIEYRLRTLIPVANLRQFVIRDELPAGISCIEAPVIDLDVAPFSDANFNPGGQITPTCTNNLVEWSFGDQELTSATSNNLFDFAVTFIARVNNIAAVNNSNIISNGFPATNAFISYVNETPTQVVQNFNQFDLIVNEPVIVLTKTYETANNDGADIITVTVTAENTGTATAYNLRVLDNLDAVNNLTYLNTGTDPPDNVDTVTLGANQPIFSWNPASPEYAIAPGQTINFNFDISVDDTAQPNEILDNTIEASWTSLPTQSTALNAAGLIGIDGASDGMRNGAIPNANDAVNDYETTATTSSTVLPLTITKTDLSLTQNPEIGAHKNFEVVISLPEGVTNNLIVNDQLDATGLSYVLSNNTDFDVTYSFSGISTINGAAPSESAFNSFPADATSANAIWNIGTVVTQTEDDTTGVPAINPSITINYFARINNDLNTNSGSDLQNNVITTYSNGEDASTVSLVDNTATITAIEADLNVIKVATPVSAAPITGGDVIEHVITVTNTGNATAYDVNITDTLPAEFLLDTGINPSVTIDGSNVLGFVATPANSPAGPLIWGRGNADQTLDIPAGSTLVLTYQVVIQSNAEANQNINNSVMVDWTSLDGNSSYERTGLNCPAVTAPNDYCAGPATATTTIDDSTTLNKQVISDTFIPSNDSIVRVGDIVTYQLSLNLQQGTTRSVSVLDVLPAGLEFVDVISINGDNSVDYSPPVVGVGSNFSYDDITAAVLPVAGKTGNLVFTLGDIVNDPFGDATTDTLTIVYRARIIEDVLAHVPATTLINTATLSYIDVAGTTVIDAARLESSSSISVRQPVMTVPTKIDRSGRPNFSNVQVATEIMNFRVASCNTSGQAPAYSVHITDQLATQLNETSIAGPLNGALQPDVYINGVLATAGVGYNYTAPVVRGGTMEFELITAVNPGQCVEIDYDIGFYTDFGANQNWNNSVTVDEYWSLPLQSGQLYSALGPTTFTMLNNNPFVPPTKTLLSPSSAEATIGDEIVYQISIPVSNAARFDVVVSDTLDSSLEFVSVSEVSGNNFVISNNSTTSVDINLSTDFIPAGQEMILQIHARVVNNTSANAGYSFNNTTIYSHTNSPGDTVILAGSAITPVPLTIIEPLLNISKAVVNTTNPGNLPTAGDILRYSVTLTAQGAGAGDIYADIFDVTLDDQLSTGLLYQTGTSTVDGAGNTINDPSLTGDGITTAQSLNWELADATADIDITEGSTVTVSYDVLVLDNVQANQTLTNSAVAQWSSVDGASVYERNGSTVPAYNDYITAAATTSIVTADNTAITKTRITDTYNPADDNVRIGDIVEYELRAYLQEGLTNNVSITDTLPQGLAFENIIAINGITTAPYIAVAPFVHNNVTVNTAGNAATGTSSLSFIFGDVTNIADANNTNDEIIIRYRARVLNQVFPQQNLSVITNNVQLDYDTATGSSNQTAAVSINLLQPQLDLTKTAVAAGGDSILDANELVTYTVDITNNGSAPAYDLVLKDIIPQGMRNGAATITPVSTSLISGATTTALTNVTPLYDFNTGLVIWNFDHSVADTYSIANGETLRIVYRVQTDTNIGAGLTLTNQVVAQLYHSFDNGDVPVAGGVEGVREIYGPGTAAASTLTTPAPGALLKENPADLTVSVGETFSYLVTIPEVPQNTTLYDVQILDVLSDSVADLTFVSVTKVDGSLAWTPVNSGSVTSLIIEDINNGIDIPAGEQVKISITVQLEDTTNNISGLPFNNTASYTYNQVDNDASTQQIGGSSTTADMTIVGPDILIVQKTGPAEMRIGIPDIFTIDVQNNGTATAWDLTVTDILPNFDPAPGGMCNTIPDNFSAQIFEADGVTAVSAPLVENVDYIVSYLPAPDCLLTFTMQSTTAALAVSQRLIINYRTSLDTDTPPNSSLTNIAGATQWFSTDTDGNGATGATRTYEEVLSDGSPTIVDYEDEHTVLIETPYVLVQKRVSNETTNVNPGSNASPGDVLRYSIFIQNVSPLAIDDFRFIDDLDALNTTATFLAGSLNLISYPVGTNISNTDAFGGTKNTGLVDIQNLTLGAAGSANDQLTIEFEVQLAPVITNGTVVLNQGFMRNIELNLPTDDPNINGVDDVMVSGDENATETLIGSAAQLEVFKTSEDMTDDPNVLLSGDTLRYTITVNNLGDENAVNVILRDQLPANTTYIANSTTLNGNPVIDVVTDELPLINGISINSASDTTPGVIQANSPSNNTNLATISFDVLIDPNLVNGTIISNQGFVSAEGAGGAVLPEKASDDPATTAIDDPTRDVIGNQPLLDVLKTVEIEVDDSTPGILDPNDILRYTITITNIGASDASEVRFTDLVPADTTYIANSVMLNGQPVAQPDGGVSPLIVGIDVSSSDLPLPTPGNGVITAGETAVITFNVQVNAFAAVGTIISNQGNVESLELADELTDSDGNDLNGDQPTLIVVGNAQLLSISKNVSVVGGGPALAGGELEYRVRVSNIGLVPAMTVLITDDLELPIAGQMSYIPGSALLDNQVTGISYAAPIITADYGTNYGSLEPGESTELRFRVQLNSSLTLGTTVTNIAQVYWNSSSQSDSASVSIDIGGTPGVGNMNGLLWHDANFNNVFDNNEQVLTGWHIDILLDGQLLGTQTSDDNGVYQINGLPPNDVGTERYELSFRAPGANNTSALLGLADSPAAYGFTNALQNISNIIIASGSNLQDLNLPIDPNGVVYNSIVRTPVAGATISLLNAASNAEVSANCFDDNAQQNQVTLADGYYKFDLNFSQPDCLPGADYLIRITPPADDYLTQASTVITPQTDETTASFNVPNCPGTVNDALSSPADFCEVQTSEFAPSVSVNPGSVGTNYYLHLRLDDTQVPGDSQIFNNHLPVDPILSGAVSISKVSSLVNVTRGQLVPYTITVTNNLPVTLSASNIIDTFPAGFKYIESSARLNDIATEPVRNGLQLVWNNIDLLPLQTQTIKLLLIVGGAVNEGEYINRAEVFDTLTNSPASGEATATVRVVPDPAFDCSDVIGKIFDDKNLNAHQDENEQGLAGVRVATARGLVASSDQDGRFHITCAVSPDELRGSNFILKVDERSLPSGFRMTTENPRVQRATRGKMMKFNFGATVHRVVSLDLADGVFVANSDEIHSLWKPRLDLLMQHLEKAPSVLHLSYLADTEDPATVESRLEKLKTEITKRWNKLNQYRLVIETEVFWRRGTPPERGGID